MMKFRKRFLAFGIVFLSAMLVFLGCAKDTYKNLKLTLNLTEQTIILSDTQADNIFSVVATTSGRPKGYSGAVNFNISNPTNSIETYAEQPVLSGGVTTAKFLAKKPGTSIINVVTSEGGKSARVVVNVIREIKNLEFKTSLLPIARNVETEIKNYINFSPYDTNQKEIALSLSLKEGGSGTLEELQKVQIIGSKILIPTSANIDNFILFATSVTNNTIIKSVEVVVVENITDEQISVYYDNNTLDNIVDDIALTKESSNYVIELARNTEEFNSKHIYFKFNDDSELDDAYIVSLQNFNSGILQVDKINTRKNTFLLKSVGDGEVILSFVIKHANYSSFESLYKYVNVKVKIVSYPKNLILTNNVTNDEITEISLFDNYSGVNAMGTPVKVVLTDNYIEMPNQFVKFGFSSPVGDKIRIRDQFGAVLSTNDLIVSGSTIFVSHIYTQAETPPNELSLIITSATYPAVSKSLEVEFIRGQIILGLDSGITNLKINKADYINEEMPFGYLEVLLTGINASFDRTTLTVAEFDTTIVSLIKTPTLIAFKGLGKIGVTNAKISAPNGSFVEITITVFEELKEEQTYIHVAGHKINSIDPETSITEIYDRYYYPLSNGLSLNIGYTINNILMTTIPGIFEINTYAQDLNGEILTNDRFVVRAVNYNLINTLNRAGNSLVEVKIRGYGNEGNQNKELIFKFIINVQIPIATIGTNGSEVTIYDSNTLSLNQLPTYSSHTIKLNTNPFTASYTYSDIKWTLLYYNIPYTVEPIYSGLEGNDIIYNFSLGNSTSTVRLVTNKLNFAEAKVTVHLAATSQNSEIFTIMAVIDQSYYNELGDEINSRKETQVKFTAVKPTKVSDIVFNNILNHTVTFDSRDLAFGAGGFTVPESQRTKVVNFNIIPAGVLTKDLAVSFSGSDIAVTVNNNNSTISIVAKTKSSTGKPIEVTVYSLDSVYGVNQYSKFTTIYVEILDGSNESLAYKVASVADLHKINNYLDAHYVLINNINIDEDINYSNWTPIGLKFVNGATEVREFTGTLNGGYTIGGKTYYYTISGLRFKNSNTEFNYNYIGLFGIIGEQGVVKNITFNNINLDIQDNIFNSKGFVYAGIVAGLNKGQVLNNTISDGNQVSTLTGEKIEGLTNYTYGIHFASTDSQRRLAALGGVVGVNYNVVANNTVSILINGNDSTLNTTLYVGGLVGINHGVNAIVTKQADENYNTLSSSFDVISAINTNKSLRTLNENSALGGAVGINTGTVSNLTVRSYIIKSLNNVGGLVGHNTGSVNGSGFVINNLSVPTIRGNYYVGGLIGFNEDASYDFEQQTTGGVVNYTAFTKNSEISVYSAFVTGNKVEFVDYNQRFSVYNTAIMANNYAGGLIGHAYSIENYDLGVHVFKNAISHNSVYSYYVTKPIRNYFENLQTYEFNYSYFGDLILNNAHASGETDNDSRNYAGGLFGKLTNGLIANNSANINIQTNGAIVGGVTGIITGIHSGSGILLIYNTSVSGNFYNRSVVSGSVVGVVSNFIGDASEISDYYLNGNPVRAETLGGKIFENFAIQNSYANIKISETTYASGFAGINENNVKTIQSFYIGQNLHLTVAFSNRVYFGDMLYHYASIELPITVELAKNGGTFGFSYVINEQGVSTNINATIKITSLFDYIVQLTGFKEDGQEGNSLGLNNTTGYIIYSDNQVLENEAYENNPASVYTANQIQYEKFSNGAYGFNIYKIDEDENGNGINDAHETQVLNAINALGINYLSVVGLNEEEREAKIIAIKNLIGNELEMLNLSDWYMHTELNGGLPALLFSNKYYLTFNVNTSIEYDLQIRLLSNWAPSDINVNIIENYSNVWVNNNKTQAMLFVNQLSSNYYLATGVIDFGNNASLSPELVRSLTSNLEEVLKQSNSYKLNEVFDIKTVPSFIGKSAISVKSSNPAILTVETLGQEVVLVAKSIGIVELTITSNYNSSVSRKVMIDVVNAIMPFNANDNSGLTLTKTSYGTQESLKNVDSFDLIKSNADNTKSVIIRAQQNNKFLYNNSQIGQVNFNMTNNLSSGTRYYLLNQETVDVSGQQVVYNTIYHNSGTINFGTIKINDTTFKQELLSNGKFVYYIDVDYASDAVLNSNVLSTNTILAVPYVINASNEKITLINEQVLSANNGRVSLENSTTLLNGYDYASQFTVKTINGTWGLNVNTNAISFDPMSQTNFTVAITTDNSQEKLFISYEDENNVTRTRRVDDFTSFKIGKITVYVNHKYLSEQKVYYFNLSISDADKINSQTYETLKNTFIRTLKFFTLYDTSVVELDGANNFVTSNVLPYIEFSKEINVTVNVQEYKNVAMSHYPSGEISVNENNTTTMNLTEVAYDNIIPGYSGILKVNVMPYFTNFDYLTITAAGTNNYVVTFEHMLANYESAESGLVFNGKYTGVYPFAENVTGGIKLTKQSYINLLTNQKAYDGNFYIRTLISSLIGENNVFVLTITAYATVNGVSSVAFTKDLTLNVITPPGLNINYNGDKMVPVAIGTSLDFNVKLSGVVGLVDFTRSYIKNSSNNKIASIGEGFNISRVSENTYRLSTSLNLSQGNEIVLIGQINKEINGEIYFYEDTMTFKLSNYVINNISVNSVINNKFVGIFNQTYDLTIKIDATYNPNLLGVETQIRLLEREISRVATPEGEHKWFYIDDLGNEVKISWKGYNAKKSYIITMGQLSGNYAGETGYKLQNIIYNSSDTLGARIKFVYGENGVEIVLNSENRPFYYEKSTRFGFGFYRVSSEDAPEPIRTVEEFYQMQSGVDYILLNDLVLENWTPISANIGSLDGNGYVITIKSFSLPDSEQSAGTLINGNVGLFSSISQGTTIKNVTIEIAPSANVSIQSEVASTDKNSLADLKVNARSFKDINFGVLAGVNSGIVTNVFATYDASDLRLERDLLIATQNQDNVDYAVYWKKNPSTQIVEFDYNAFLQANISKYFPRKVISEANKSNLWSYETNSVDYSKVGESVNARRDLSILIIDLLELKEDGTRNVAGLVGVNTSTGYITNSAIENITINGDGFVAGLVANNAGKISTSYFKGGNIINRVEEYTANSATAGLVVENTGSIQYSYVFGREGDGNSYQYAVTLEEEYINEDDDVPMYTETPVYTKSRYSDKTGLSVDLKSTYAGSFYNSFRFAKNGINYDYNYKHGALRAMNSMVWSGGYASGFVYRNAGLVSNSYSNILINSSTATAGFVHENLSGARISDVYSLSSVQISLDNHNAFTGRNTGSENYNNAGIIEYAHYLRAKGSLNSIDDESDENFEVITVEYEDSFSKDKNEPATAVQSFSEFADYNSFQGYAFNSDYSSNAQIEKSVWFIPNGRETLENNTVLKDYFKSTIYLQNRPELVAANLKTLSVRLLISGSGSVNNEYSYVSGELALGKSIKNPIIIRSAEEFNKFVTTYKDEDTVEQHNSIRFVSDIAFNQFDIKANTYMIDYYGDLDGNGMNIDELRLVSNSDFETIDEEFDNLTKLGLFGSIRSRYENNKIVSRGVVRNINISVSEVRGTNATYVGVLAGIIEDASVFNITIDGNEIIQGKHIVGGLAGYITGDSEIVNITVKNIGAKASYYKNVNPFSTGNYLVSHENMGKFVMFNSHEVDGSLTNENSLSYVGGVAGIMDVDEVKKNDDSTLRSARARKLTVEGNVVFVGEVVGGVFGGVGVNSTANDLTFVIKSGTASNGSPAPRLVASRLAGGIVGDLRGIIDRAALRHEQTLQNIIDNALKTTASGTSRAFINHASNYNALFSGNPIYMGGLVGFNYGGTISNSYSKLNVLNLNALYAGGIAGLNMSGQYNNVYTTGSVSAFKTVGGVIGIASQKNTFLTDYSYENVGAGKGSYIYNENYYEYVGQGNGNYNIVIVHTWAPELENNKNNYSLMFIDIENSKLPQIETGTVMGGISAINVWREQDLNTNARTSNYLGSDPLIIGAIAGRLVIGTEKTVIGEIDKKYFLDDVFNVTGAMNTSTRRYNDINYFNQPFLNTPLGTIPKVSGGSVTDYGKIMQEFGQINNGIVILSAANNTSKLYRSQVENDLRIINDGGSKVIDYTGVSGNVAVEIKDNNDEVQRINHYHYSRMQNMGSARTIREFINRRYIQEEAVLMGELTSEKPEITEGINVSLLPVVYYNWPATYWKGTRVVNNENFGYELDEPEYVFPHIVPIADMSSVEVRTADDLALMKDFTKATYILMNDIDLSIATTYLEWTPAGTAERPFSGTIISYNNAQYTIKNLKINADLTPYIGLAGFVQGATFNGFNLTVLDINFNNVASENENYVGTLFGYGEKVNVNKINISSTGENNKFTLSSYSVASMGGLAAVALESKISNVTVTNGSLSVLSAVKTSQVNGLYVGGAVGYLSTDLKLIVLENVEVNDVKINVLPTSTLADNFIVGKIAVGGVFGYAQGEGTSNKQGVNLHYNAGSDSSISLGVRYVNENSRSIYLSEVSVGGLVGLSNAINYNNVSVNGHKTETTVGGQTVYNYAKLPINLTTAHFIENTYIGGAFGNYSGRFAEVGKYNTHNLIVNNAKVSYNSASYTALGGETKNSIHIGGVYGNFSSSSMNNIYGESEIVVSASQNKIGPFLNVYVGGIAGNSTRNSATINVISNSNIYLDNTNSYPLYGNNNSIGGVFGNLQGNNVGQGLSNIVANGSINKFAVHGTSSVGGIIGSINNSNISEVMSNVNINISNVSNTIYVGGLVGKATTSSSLDVNGRVAIANSYSAGDISVSTNITAVSTSRLGGILGYAQVAYDSVNESLNSLTIENVYSISKFIFNDSNNRAIGASFANETQKGGIVGEIYQDIYNHSNTKNIRIHNAYYNSELIPYSNNFGKGLTVNDMLFNSNQTKVITNEEGQNITIYNHFEGFENVDIWQVSANSYPLLSWLTNANSWLTQFNILQYQAKGTEQSPIIYSSGTLSDNSAYIITGAFDPNYVDLNNVSLYFTSASHELVDGFSTISNNSLIYGAKISDAVIAENNYGFLNNITGLVELDDNKGVLFYTDISKITTNNGLLDKVRRNSSNENTEIVTNNGLIVSSIVKVTTNNGSIRTSYYNDTTNQRYVYYSSTSNVINTGYDENKLMKNYAGWNNQTGYNFEKDWAMFTVNGLTALNQIELNRGAPMLRWTLKSHWLNEDLDSNYLWTQNFNFEFGEIIYNNDIIIGYNGLLSDLSAVINGSKTITINTAEDLSKVAFMTSVGKVISVTQERGYGEDKFTVNKTGIVNVIKYESYSYGVKTTTIKHVVDYSDITLQLANNISLSGKLWTPIGYGFNDEDVTLTTNFNKDRNAFKGKITGNDYIISNIAVIETNSNAGLFGVVEVNTTGTDILASFANNIIMENGFVAAINNSLGQGKASAGALVGKLFYGETALKNYVINGFGNQNVNIYSNNYAGGIFGQIIKNSSSTNVNNVPVIYKAYAISDVNSATGYAGGFGYDLNVLNTINNTTVFVREVYFIGNLNAAVTNSFVVGNTGPHINYSILNNASVLATEGNTSAYSSYNSDPNTLVTKLTEEEFKYSYLPNFNWENNWLRIHYFNNMYPTFIGEINYWINDITPVTESGGVYEISTPQELAWVAYSVNRPTDNMNFSGKTIKLVNDINLSDALWTPIGYSSSRSFNGTFNGDGYKITNIISYGTYMPSGVLTNFVTNNYVGLFGYVNNSTLQNVIIETGVVAENKVSIINGNNYVGGIVGYAGGTTTINNVTNGSYVYGNSRVGGIAGDVSRSTNTTFTNLTNKGVVSGVSYVAGVIGYANNITINSSLNTGSVSALNYVGGIVGRTNNSLLDNRNTGAITGETYIGGIVGNFAGTGANVIKGINLANLSSTYDNTGTITGSQYIGGIAGYSTGEIEAVTNDGLVKINTKSGSNSVYAGGIVGYTTNNIFEVINRANVTTLNSNNTQYVGGIVGEFAFSSGKMMKNLFTTTSSNVTITSNTLTNNGLLVGAFTGGVPTINNINMAIASNNGIFNVIGSYSSKVNTVDVSSKISSVNVPNPINGEIISENDLFELSYVWNGKQLNYKEVAKPTGSGTSLNPYIINSTNKFAYLNYIYKRRLNDTSTYAYYQISENITLSLAELIANKGYPFIGSINLNDKTITLSNLNDSFVGFVRYAVGTSSAYTKIYDGDIVINSASSTSYNNVGGLLGKGDKVELYSIDIKSGSTSTLNADYNAGSLVGTITNSTIYSITNNIGMNGNRNIGGIVGNATSSSIEINVVNGTSGTTTKVNGSENIGGIAGLISETTIIGNNSNRVVNYMPVQGKNNVGGIVGSASATARKDISYTSNTGNITIENGNAGGVVGYANSTNVRVLNSVTSGTLTIQKEVVVDLWNSQYVESNGNNKKFEWWGLQDEWKGFMDGGWPWKWGNKVVKQRDTVPSDITNALSNGFSHSLTGYTFGALAGLGINNTTTGSSSTMKMHFSKLVYYSIDFDKHGRELDWYMEYNIKTLETAGYSQNYIGSENDSFTFYKNSSSTVTQAKETGMISAGSFWRPDGGIWTGSPHDHFKDKRPSTKSIMLDLSGVKVAYAIGETFTSAGIKVYYFNGSTKTQIQTTSNPTYSVDSSSYKANIQGNYFIIVSYTRDGETFSESYSVKVGEGTGSELRLDLSSVQTEFEFGELFNSTNLGVSLYFNGQFIENLTSDQYVVDSIQFNPNVADTYTITIIFTDEDVTINANYNVTVLPEPDPIPEG